MKLRAIIRISAVVLALLFLFAGCSTAANIPSATSAPASATVAPTATTAPTQTPAATEAPTAAPTVAPTATPAPTAKEPDLTVDSPAFKLYNLVKLGMTKDEVDKAVGQAGEAQSDYDKENSIFTYTDEVACGVRVTYNDDKKAYAKEVFYNDIPGVLGPLNPKPVTHDEYDQISTSATYTEVVSILGSDGVIGSVTADKSDCVSNQAYKRFWGNPDGSYIEIDFKPDGTIDSLSYNDYQPE